MILVTGAEGLIGRHLCDAIETAGQSVRRFDHRRSSREDICDPAAVESAVEGVSGVVHLAAMSRLASAESDPERCYRTNVLAVDGLLRACRRRLSPWIVFASSREVYGRPDVLPVAEDAELQPVNIYGRSKRDGEILVQKAAAAGMIANICRFSNVYGYSGDHKDRVVMAFARAAAWGGTISVEGGGNTYDFTSVHDVVDGARLLIQKSIRGTRLPPVHFVSGRGTTLRKLASIAAANARKPVAIREISARDPHVEIFVGDPTRAATLLGWSARTDIEKGLAKLIEALAAA